MLDLIRRKPWILIVVLLGSIVLANVVLLVVSIAHPAVPVAGP